ncbi:hypothetical protein BURCENK562V_C1638 [Burkholderia cenocepacia K56-2Valvano]|nr:hypothetical protein BURCENK562V_C1638 [Burkholderia cenocepacia K56-2Valvano]
MSNAANRSPPLDAHACHMRHAAPNARDGLSNGEQGIRDDW